MKHNSDVPGQLALFAIAPTSETRTTIHDPYWDEILAPQQAKENRWNPADFGEIPHKVDEDGQLTIFYESLEPPDPDDYENLEDYEQAWAEWVGVKVGDLVKLSSTWMDKCAAATTGKFRKDYQYKSDNELISEVIWVDPLRGHIYVGRGNNNALFVPCGCYTVETRVGAQVKGDTVAAIVETRVGGQVVLNTEKVAPQHDAHWVEKYWVERSGNKYWYYRYCWMVGRKKNRVYLGSVSSIITRRKKADVEVWIRNGLAPVEIEKLIRQQRSPQSPILNS
ncbi:MAG: hypothetical protein HWQ44_22585 [Nostoc sp. JL34]|uniref:hypothetical protein n=1 Tax=Nostoc sp. JL34 TaxID=2815397 RepID=UPI001DDA6A91|nr:hypothetical protein [Nostoc sp. JL34]MBN3885635.1 hypothetical protein [Nostoc sp. JL34]